MSIEKAIHAIWPTVEPLQAVMPAARVFTGRVPPKTAMPYCRIDHPIGSNAGRTNEKLLRDEQIRILTWADSFSSGRAVQKQIEDAFASRDFSTDDGEVTDMAWDDSSNAETDTQTDWKWLFITIFGLKANQPRVL
jgi:hypothetical protein